jgi:nucleoside-diphosphate-sugar epimerase
LNRGNRPALPGVKVLRGDVKTLNPQDERLAHHQWDAVVDWVAFTQTDVEHDFELFAGRTQQYVFISSASCYKARERGVVITEEWPLENPHWEYSRNKIAAENRLLELWNAQKFPVTIVRPSHTYRTVIPVPIGGWNEYTIAERILNDKPIVVHDDGKSLWTLTRAEDFAVAFAGMLGAKNTIGEVFHITSDEALTWNEIYVALGKALGKTPILVQIPTEFIVDYAETHHVYEFRGSLMGDKAVEAVFDNAKIKRIVPEFKTTIKFEQGIRLTLDWFDAEPTRKIVNEEMNQFIDTLIEAYRLSLQDL